MLVTSQQTLLWISVGGWGWREESYVTWFKPQTCELRKKITVYSVWKSVRRYTVHDKTAQTFNKMCKSAKYDIITACKEMAWYPQPDELNYNKKSQLQHKHCQHNVSSVQFMEMKSLLVVVRHFSYLEAICTTLCVLNFHHNKFERAVILSDSKAAILSAASTETKISTEARDCQDLIRQGKTQTDRTAVDTRTLPNYRERTSLRTDQKGRQNYTNIYQTNTLPLY